MAGPFSAIDAFDRRLLHRLTRKRRRRTDRNLTRVTHSANRSLLWLVIAFVMAASGGRIGRRAALRGVVAIAVTSTLVNGPLKFLLRRPRPVIRPHDRRPLVAMPASFSFPSGHSASAFAFTTAAGMEDPRIFLMLLPIAAAVGYSRVHLRVHYPFDVLAGAAIGTGAGIVSHAGVKRAREWWDSHAPAPPHLQPPTRDLVLVCSPHAGRGEELERVRREMARVGLRIRHEVSIDQLSQLESLLQEDGTPQPLLVAAGGDGTVGTVSNYAIKHGAILGVVPLGTSNDFARSLEIPIHVENAVRLLAMGRVSTVDVGRLVREGERPQHFVHAASAGLNVNFAHLATRADLRKRLGHLTYAFAGAKAMREAPVFEAEISTNGEPERLQLTQLAVMNTPIFGGALGLRVPGGDPDDRRLEVLLVEHLPLRRFLRSLLYPALGIRRRIRGIRMLQVSSVTVRPAQPLEVALDGEVSGKIPGTFEVVPDGLKIITPASFNDVDDR